MFKFAYGDIDFAYKLDTASDPRDEYFNHMHYFNELIFFIDGNVDYTVETDARKLTAGDIIFIPSGKYHYAKVDKEKKYERFVLKFPNTVLPAFLQDKLGELDYFISGRQELAINFKQLDAYYGNYTDEELYTLYVGELTKILIFLCKNSVRHSQPRQTDMMSQIVYYIDTHIKESLSLDVLSDKFNYSKTYISSEFKKHMHVSPMEYIKTKKIIAAHDQIIGGKRKHEVAENFGFEDYSTFYRTYKRIMGFAPSDGKKQ